MSKVIVFNGITTLDIPVERVLDGAKHLQSVIVIGRDENGKLHFASNRADSQKVLWDLMRARQILMGQASDATD